MPLVFLFFLQSAHFIEFFFSLRRFFSFLYIVDAAAAEPNSLKRLAYVAAFAMSNYSSTEGRIAKPFNPMLVRAFFKIFLLPWEKIDI